MQELTDFLRTRRKMNLILIGINLAVYLVLEWIGDTENASFMLRWGACYTPSVLDGEYWRLFTAMFLHFGFRHIVCNMFSLLFLGDILESMIGPVRYLLIYLAGGLAGNLLSMALELRSDSYAISAGASGCIFAVTGALLLLAIRNRGKTGQLDARRIGMMVLLMVLQGAVDTGVDNAAHIGGLVAGFLLALLLCPPRRRRMRQL